MKFLLRIFVFCIILLGCTPEDIESLPEVNVPPKISALKLIRSLDTTTYTFQYNEDTSKLTSVLRNGEWYSTITYGTNQAIVEMDKGNLEHDTFSVNLSSNSFIDSINSLLPEYILYDADKVYSSIKGLSNKLFESDFFLDRYFQSQNDLRFTHLSEIEFDLTNNNLTKFNVGITYNSNTFEYRDSIGYIPTLVNQPNLPDQFITSLQSYRVDQGVPILTPLFLLQQSNIYPYVSHSNLINNLQTYEIDFSLAPIFYRTTDYFYNYNYTFDSLSRVIQMDVYLNSSLYLTYKFQYFD